MSVIIAADPHIGVTTHGTALRFNEAHDMCLFIRERAYPGSLILAGDTFNTPHPPAWAYSRVQDLTGGLAVDAIMGNHEGTDALYVLQEAQYLNFHERPVVITRDEIDFALVPWFGRAFVAATYPDLVVGQQNAYMASALERIVADLASEKREGVPMVCVTHFAISGASYDSGEQPMVGEGGDFVAPWRAFDRPEFSLVVSGHIHQPQTLHGGRLIYVGAPIHTTFSKTDYQTRILQLDRKGDGVVVTSIPTPSIEFVSIDVNGEYGTQDCPLVAGKVVRFVGELPAGEQTAALLRSLTDVAYLAGALKVAKPAVRFTRHDAHATRIIAVETSPHDALREYAAQVGGEYEARLPELLMLHDELEGER
jgi:DNA repair exonuclease SbcCD nuclease subunit